MEGETEEERFERAQQEAGIKKAEFQGEEETRKSLIDMMDFSLNDHV